MMCGNYLRNTAPSHQPYRISVSCPSCGSSNCIRHNREGLRDFLYQFVGKFPWKCPRCLHRFYLNRRRR